MAQTIKVTDPDLKKRLEAIEYADGCLADLALGRSLAEELIAERRAEARAGDQVKARRHVSEE